MATDLSSDDAANAIFSDDALTHTSSPPSSPVSATRPMRDAFAILGKRKALSPLVENVRPLKQRVVSIKRPSSSNSNLTQLQISLGQTVSKKCPTCGMTYITSSPEDRKLHDKFHKQHIEGYDVGKSFVTALVKHDPSAVRETSTTGESDQTTRTCTITSKSPSPHKRHAKAILQLVEQDLGAIPIPESALFHSNSTYTFHLYIRNTKCIAVLLTESVSFAFPVIEPTVPSTTVPLPQPTNCEKEVESGKRKGSTTSALAALKARQKAWAEEDMKPVTVSGKKVEARLGVSRIWTSPTYRGQDLARKLLDAALACEGEKTRQNTEGGEQGTTLRKEHIAFSHPTTAGSRLARKWFGRRYGWLVYVS